MAEPFELVQRCKIANSKDGYRVGDWYLFATQRLGSYDWGVMMAPVVADRRKQYMIASGLDDWSIANDFAYAVARALAVPLALKEAIG
jgi:hypothetical protein